MKSLATKIAGKVMDLAERERCLNKDHLIEAIETELLANSVRPSATEDWRAKYGLAAIGHINDRFIAKINCGPGGMNYLSTTKPLGDP